MSSDKCEYVFQSVDYEKLTSSQLINWENFGVKYYQGLEFDLINNYEIVDFSTILEEAMGLYDYKYSGPMDEIMELNAARWGAHLKPVYMDPEIERLEKERKKRLRELEKKERERLKKRVNPDVKVQKDKERLAHEIEERLQKCVNPEDQIECIRQLRDEYYQSIIQDEDYHAYVEEIDEFARWAGLDQSFPKKSKKLKY